MKDPSVPEIDAATQILRAPLKYPVHPLCAMYPDYTPEALVELAGDVGAHSLRDPITFTPDGRLLDGKNRVRACELAGVEITSDMTEVHHGDPLAFVISKNDQRRHMTEEQRRATRAKLAAFAAAETEAGAGGDRRSDNFKSATADLKDEKKAKAFANDVSYVRAIEKHGTPEEKAAVFSGKAPMRKTAQAALARARAPAKKMPLPIEEVVERELLAKCSSLRPLWQRPDKMASIINRSVAVVKEALVRLHEKGLAEGQKAPDGIWFEYWVPDKSEPKATDSLDADIRIIELEDEIAELKRENVELKRENADLKAQLGERDDEIARLRPRFGETGPSSSTDEQLERFESEEAERAAPSRETVH
jgi:hypothetical protein